MTPLNGKPAAPGPTETPPHHVVAERVYENNMAGDDPHWAELSEDDRLDIAEYVEDILQAHVEFLTAAGFKLVPPGATPLPRTEAEAMGMLQAAKQFFDAQKRKGKLMGGADKRFLMMPPSGKMQ